MMITIDQYAYESKLKQLSPMLKMALSLITLFLCVLISENLFSLLVFCLMAWGCIVWSGVGVRTFCKLCAIPLGFLLIGVLTIAVSFPTEPVGLVHIRLFQHYIAITAEGLALAGNIFLKSMAGVSCLYFLYVTTPIGEILGVLDRFKVPQILTELMMMIYRFIFILFNMMGQMRVASHARLGNISYRKSLITMAKTSTSLFVNSFKKSTDILNAMEARAYQGAVIYIGELPRTTKKQCILLVCYILLLLILGVLIKFGWFK